MGVTMKDVARKAGVSQPTVSAALGGKPSGVRVGEEARRRIHEAAEALGYRGNAMARSMKTGKSMVLGFVGPFSNEGYVLEMLAGVCLAAQRRGYLVKLFPLRHGEDDGLVFRQCVEQCLEGVVFRNSDELALEALCQELAPNHIPLVQLDNVIHRDWRAVVGTDDLDGMRQAVRHLAALGHRRIGHLTAVSTSSFVATRQCGFELGLRELGLEATVGATLRLPGHFELREDLFFPPLDAYFERFAPTALACATDPLAIKLLNWARTRGVDVPGRLSVTGYGGVDYSQISSPPLTTVAQPFEAMGARAAEKLLEIVEDGITRQDDEFLPVKLIVRGTTARPGNVTERERGHE